MMMDLKEREGARGTPKRRLRHSLGVWWGVNRWRDKKAQLDRAANPSRTSSVIQWHIDQLVSTFPSQFRGRRFKSWLEILLKVADTADMAVATHIDQPLDCAGRITVKQQRNGRERHSGRQLTWKDWFHFRDIEWGINTNRGQEFVVLFTSTAIL